MKRNSITCPGTTHSTFCLNCKSNLLSPPLQHQIASARPPGFMGTTGLCFSEVPWAEPRLVLCFQDRSRGQKDQPQIQTENKDYRQTETEDKKVERTGGCFTLHSFIPQSFTHTTYNVPSFSSRNLCHKDQDGNDRFLPTNSDCLGKFNPLYRIGTVNGIWKSDSYQTATAASPKPSKV